MWPNISETGMYTPVVEASIHCSELQFYLPQWRMYTIYYLYLKLTGTVVNCHLVLLV